MAIRFQPNNPIALVQHAKALIINGQPEEAIILLEKLNKDFPDNDNFKQNLSTAYREIGEFKKANKISVIGFKKDYKNIAYLLGFTKGKDNKLQEEQIEYYNQLLERENIKLEDKALICHSFFEYFKNQKDYDKAGSYLIKGNEAQYLDKSFDLKIEKVFFKKLKTLFSKKIDFVIKKIKNKYLSLYVACQDQALHCVNKFFHLTPISQVQVN